MEKDIVIIIFLISFLVLTLLFLAIFFRYSLNILWNLERIEELLNIDKLNTQELVRVLKIKILAIDETMDLKQKEVEYKETLENRYSKLLDI